MDEKSITERNETTINIKKVIVLTPETDNPDGTPYTANKNAKISKKSNNQNSVDETLGEETKNCKDCKKMNDDYLTITNNVTVLSSDTVNSGDVSYNADKDYTITINEENANFSAFLNKAVDKVENNCKDSTSFSKNETTIVHNNVSATKVKMNKNVHSPISESGTTSVQSKIENQKRNEENMMNNEALKNSKVNFTHRDIPENLNCINWFCLKLSYGLNRHRTEQKSQANLREIEMERNIDDENNLEKQYENLKSTNDLGNLGHLKEMMKDTVHRSKSNATKNRENYNPLRRTYQVYFGEMTAGGIEYGPENWNPIVPIFLIIVFIMLCLSCAFNIWWLDTLALEEWHLMTYDPAVCFTFGVILTVMLDLLFASVPVARHPIFTWPALIAQGFALNFITFYIGANIRIPLTDNVVLIIIIPGVITAMVTLHLICVTLFRTSLTKGATPFLVAIGAAIITLIVVTVFACQTLFFQVWEMFACWINTLYYVISMLILLQMILTQKVYSMYEYDVALPALMLFTSPYSVVTNGIRWFLLYRGY